MNNNTNSTFYKGLGMGIVVGSAISMAVKTTQTSGKTGWGRTLKSAGEVIENVTNALGL